MRLPSGAIAAPWFTSIPSITPTTLLVAGSMMCTLSPALLVWMMRIFFPSLSAARGAGALNAIAAAIARPRRSASVFVIVRSSSVRQSTLSAPATRDRSATLGTTGPPLPCNRVRVDARIGARAQHAGLRIHDDRRERSHRPRPREAQLVPARHERRADALRHPVFHRHLARIHRVRERRRREAPRRPPRRLDRLLHVHPEI